MGSSSGEGRGEAEPGRGVSTAAGGLSLLVSVHS